MAAGGLSNIKYFIVKIKEMGTLYVIVISLQTKTLPKSRYILEISCLMQHACIMPHPYSYESNQQLSKASFKTSSIAFTSFFILAIIYLSIKMYAGLLFSLFHSKYLNWYQSMCFLMRCDNCI